MLLEEGKANAGQSLGAFTVAVISVLDSLLGMDESEEMRVVYRGKVFPIFCPENLAPSGYHHLPVGVIEGPAIYTNEQTHRQTNKASS